MFSPKGILSVKRLKIEEPAKLIITSCLTILSCQDLGFVGLPSRKVTCLGKSTPSLTPLVRTVTWCPFSMSFFAKVLHINPVPPVKNILISTYQIVIFSE